MNANESIARPNAREARDAGDPGNTITPLDGEPGIPSVIQPRTVTVSRKGVVAVALLALSLVAVSAISIQKAVSGHRKDDEASKRNGDRPTAAAGDPRRLDMSLPPVAASAPIRMIPAIIPTPEETRADPIPVRRTETPRPSPEDAPVLLVLSRPGGSAGRSADGANGHARDLASGEGSAGSDDALAGTRRSLEVYQRQLQGLLNSLTKQQPLLPNGGLPIVPTEPAPSSPPAAGLFDGELEKSATPRVAAGLLGNRSLTLPKGTAFTCALKTKVISATSGLIGCDVQRNVYGHDGRVVLIERGSHVDGEYRIASARPGTVRIPVLWTRVLTPNGVTVDIDSPGTGPLGESGIDGYVDNRWPERIGAAMLLSLIDDSVKLVIQNQGSDRAGDTVILPSTTSNTSKLAEKVLDSTINIPPLIYQNQGGIVGIYVARDVDFSSVYELKPLPR